MLKERMRSNGNELLHIFVKSIISIIIFYSIYHFKFTVFDYDTILDKIVDVVFFNIIANSIAILISFILFKSLKVKTNFDRIKRRYFNADALLRLMFDSVLTGVLFALSINFYENVSLIEFLRNYFIINTIIKIAVSFTERKVKKRNQQSPAIIVFLILMIFLILKFMV